MGRLRICSTLRNRIMKCESCGNELIGAAIICRACNHNNALHKKLAWRRPEPRQNQSTRSCATGDPSAELPTIVPRKDSDVNLLHFPSALNRRNTRAEAASDPPWRAELRERVRRIKEKRATSGPTSPNPSAAQPSRVQVGEAKPGRNPIVEAALNRIRWASRKMEGQRDRETEGQKDRGNREIAGTEGQRDRRDRGMEELLTTVSPSLRPSVSPSLRPSVSPSLRPSVSPSRAPMRASEVAQYRDARFCVSTSRPKANPAPLFARLLAASCDMEIVIMAFLLIFGAYAMSNDAASFGYGSRLLMALALSSVVFTYQIVMLAFAGRTFGMALLKLNLVNAGDESLPVTLWQKLLRASVATIVSICFPLCLAAWFSASRRTLPDLVSGTTVA
jgi:uncharacterized RDD family membrane protein YckC